METLIVSKKAFIDAKELGVMALNHRQYSSDYAFFHQTFVGFDFKDINTGKIRSKLSIFWSNPTEAMKMAMTLKVPAEYQLVNAPGWRNGYRIFQ